jgi:hypothetical protein
MTVVTKRDDPNYAQVSGHIPKDKALEFKVACTRKQISQSEALEEAIDKWLADQEELLAPIKDSKKPRNTGETSK